MYRMSEKPLITADAIKNRIRELAAEINSSFDYDILLSSLTGAFMFTADLSKALAEVQKEGIASKRIAFIKASSYGNSMQSSGSLKVTGIDTLDIRDKKVLLVDDIADSGKTLLELSKIVLEKGAKEVRTCVLLNKQERREVEITADFVGFEIANEFVIGYGLDYAEEYRLLPEIWTLQETT